MGIILLMASFGTANSIDDPPAFAPPLVLNFDVLYGGYKIGEIDITQSGEFQYEKQTVRELECRVESSVIIDHHGLYRSIVDTSYSVLYMKADNTTAGKRRIDEYWIDRQNKRVRIKSQGPESADISEASISLADSEAGYFDSISMVFKLRAGLDSLLTPVYIPVFVYSRQDSILVKSVADASVPGPDGTDRKARRVSGYIPFRMFPGAGNEFEIYISDDDQKIPLRAELEMALGRLEMIPRPR